MRHILPCSLILASFVSAQAPNPLATPPAAPTEDVDISGDWVEAGVAHTTFMLEGIPMKGMEKEFVPDIELVSTWGAEFSITQDDKQVSVDCSPVYGGEDRAKQAMVIPIEPTNAQKLEVDVGKGSKGEFAWTKQAGPPKLRALVMPYAVTIMEELYVVKDAKTGAERKFTVMRMLRLQPDDRLLMTSTVRRALANGALDLLGPSVAVSQSFVRG